jgi:hypothetical protein
LSIWNAEFCCSMPTCTPIKRPSLLADGSKHASLWGINLYPDAAGEDWLEFDAMINLRRSSATGFAASMIQPHEPRSPG